LVSVSKHRISLALSSALLALLAACTGAVWQSEDRLASGFSYSLPKTILTVTIEAWGHRATEAVATLNASEIAATGDGGVVRTMALIDGERRSVLVDKDGKLAEDIVTSLRIANITSEQVADLSHSYVLQYNASSFASDRVCAGVNEKGLLSYVEAATKDETANIIVSIAKFAGRLAGPSLFVAGAGAPQKFDDLQLKMDPYSEADRRAAAQTISERYPSFKGRIQLFVDTPRKPKTGIKPDICPPGRVCYRTAVPMRVALHDKASRKTSVRYATVANLAEVSNIDVTRALFVEKVSRLGFSDGMLQYATIRKPSEALELARLPMTVYDAILTSALAAPGQFAREIIPGASPEHVLEVLTAQAAAANDIDLLRKDLARLREDIGANEQPGTVKTETVALLRLSCKFSDLNEKPKAGGG
jgi:hypothetical protein